MKVAVISDTHGLLRDEVKAIIEECGAVIHAGDIASKKLLVELKAVSGKKHLYIVRGNNDRTIEELPEKLSFELEGKSFFMIHDLRDMPPETKADIVISGHTHKYRCEQKGDTLFLNPGSCGRRRFSLPSTMAVLVINNERVYAEKLLLEAPNGASKARAETVEKIMKLTASGADKETICKKLRIREEATERIIRIIVTHPGIDVQGVLDRLDA